MKILAFGFKENLSGSIVEQLDEQTHKIILESEVCAIDNFLESTNLRNYDYILGVGSYSGVDKDRIRIETVCTSQFRNDKSNLITIKMKPFFQSSKRLKLTYRIGNSYCNLVSYKILAKYPDLKFTFLHVPRDYSQKHAIEEINSQLQTLI